ncbi:hypothetical protein M0R45_030649 [Rubus argutus]|uniref:Uncharacterized protein n=1 Tax=Rubus argutus TaxID=59490 RepID=A0AAW1WFA9_RUBAR
MFPANPPDFEVHFDLFRSLFDLVPVMKVASCAVASLPVKFGDHRRWSETRCVRCTRRRFGRRVAARPAFSGKVV